MKHALMLLALLIGQVSLAENVVRLEGISIQGNSEEPNVMYITPWRPSPGTGRLYQPVSSYRLQWLTETDRESFTRELRYAERYAPQQPDAERLRQLSQSEQ